LDTLTQGQADDLKMEDGNIRVWLSRCDTLDGEPYDNTVTVEAREDGCWFNVFRYDGDDPPERLVDTDIEWEPRKRTWTEIEELFA
jgi:hypothetical protein